MLLQTKPSDNEQAEPAPSEEEPGSALSEYAGESENETLQAAVTDILDRLYRFATRLRNPATRTTKAKTGQFAQVDNETGIDLIKQFKKLDLDHVQELLLSYRSSNSKESEDRGKTLSVEDDALILRLAVANTYRRQQFGQWARHRVKGLKETARALEELGPVDPNARRDESTRTPISKAFSKPTTASHLLNPTQIRLDGDAASALSGKTMSPTAQGTDDDQVEVPDPPSKFKGQEHFQCPYCCMLCTKAHLEKKAWRSDLHLSVLLVRTERLQRACIARS